MDEKLLDNINSVVHQNDTLWFLGDFAFGRNDHYYGTCLKYRNQIRCKNVYMVWGNHDRKIIKPIFSDAMEVAEYSYQNVSFFLSHYAHAVWKDSHKSRICLYGHSHGSAEKWLDEHMPGRQSMDVGVDNAAVILGDYRPFSYDEIMDIMSSRKGFFIDHHE